MNMLQVNSSARLGFLGMTDVRLFYAEGLGLGAERAEQAVRGAQADIEAAIA